MRHILAQRHALKEAVPQVNAGHISIERQALLIGFEDNFGVSYFRHFYLLDDAKIIPGPVNGVKFGKTATLSACTSNCISNAGFHLISRKQGSQQLAALFGLNAKRYCHKRRAVSSI
jgi:hypothetical protein